MSPRTGMKPEAAPRRTRSLAGNDLAAVLVASALAALACAVLTREPARVEQLTVNNPSAYELTVQARGAPDQAWTPVLIIGPGRTAPALDVVDQGATWTFRFSGQGREAGTFDVTRDQLRDGGWRLDVPATAAETLRVQGLSPTPQAVVASP